MTKKNTSTPLTLEVFDEKILPRLEKIMEEYKKDSNEKYDNLESKFDNLEGKVNEYRTDIVGMKTEVLFEVQKLRDEVTVATHQYQRTNKRVDLIDEHVGISTSNLA